MGDTLLEKLAGSMFMPHGHCYLWQPAMVWLQVTTNAAIGLAYVAISALLVRLTFQVKELPFIWIYVSFGVFIVSCGLGHFMDVLVIWYPVYWVDGAVRVLTALASVGTALALPGVLPKIRALAAAAGAARERGIMLQTAVADLEKMYRRSRTAEEVKARFFANVSHELRTPLTLILAPLAQLSAEPGLSTEARFAIDVMRRNATLLLIQVNTLLDLAKLDDGMVTLAYRRGDLAYLLRRLAACFAGDARARQITWEIDAPASLAAECDVHKVERVLLNLLGNARKFTPAGGRILCRLQHDIQQDVAVLLVADSGPGVPAERRQAIFDRFVQAEAGVAVGGSGLGLAIVAEFVRLHGGEVDVGESPLGGAAFTMRLPLKAPAGTVIADGDGAEIFAPAAEPAAAEAAAAGAPAVAAEAGGAGADAPLILIAEDHQDMRHAIARSLRDRYRVMEAADGVAALTAARERLPDLVVSDWNMPNMTGPELIDAMRGDPALAEVPVMLLTAQANAEDRVTMLARGARDYLAKPFNEGELRARVDNLIEMARARAILQVALDSQAIAVDELAARLRDRTDALDEACVRAQRAQQAAEQLSNSRQDFLNLMSHELRTPLTALELQGQRLARLLTEELPQGLVREMLAISARLRALVESLLTYNQAQRRRLVLEPADVDVAALAADCVATVRARAPADAAVVTVAVAEPARLRTDPELLRLVITNLVDNALKFGGAGGRAEVTGKVTAEGLDLEISDEGPGIAEADRGRIFVPFVHLEPISQKHIIGVGLGLALVKEAVDVLGGTIVLAPAAARGARFIVHLPPVGAL